MSPYAITTMFIAVIGAVAEVGLSIATTSATPPPLGLVAMMMVFLVGPLAFLALLAWRRRTHPRRSHVLLLATMLIAAAGIGVLGVDYFYSRTQPIRRILDSNPAMLPTLQWVAAVAVWLILVIVERREKRAAASGKK